LRIRKENVLESLVEILIFGLIKGCIYALIASGFALIFSVAGIVNLAHGTFYMLGAYFSYYLFTMAGIPLALAIFFSAIAVGVFGFLMDLFLLKPMRNSHSYVLVLTIAVAFAVQELILIICGPQGKNLPNLVSGSVNLFKFDIIVSWHQILVIFITACILIVLWIVLTRTKYGSATLAVSMDEIGAYLVGINSDNIFRLVMFSSAFLAAIAGGIISSMLSIHPNMWEMPLVKAFVIVVIGGLTSVAGSIIAAFALAFLETFVAFAISTNLAEVVSLFILIIFLIFRPSGILGRKI
jgi:branched-chain amino acid transport system permease protein